ncbi:C-type lectin domain family 4 member E-like [Mya arenaria]|uniref:C-type lectin domain family 4 member E-like n=1 Tax=Mya arenaria TaxID=6604 RepID=UPI0022E7F0A4|nr:C-type lectin domain family 4 member E-like [Mya arenaria]
MDMRFGILFLIGLVASECPDGWLYYQHSCYMFGHSSHTFMDAVKYCEHFNATMLNVNTREEQNFLKSFMSNLKEHYYWIGLTDEVIDGVWRLYPSEQPSRVFDWYAGAGEPQGGTVENCVHAQPGYGYQWADVSCSSTASVVCEKDSSSNGVQVIGRDIQAKERE